jgi:hypothetical protein
MIPDRNGKEHCFKLQSIIYHQAARKHFVSIHRVDNSFIFADHMLERQKDDIDKGGDKKRGPLKTGFVPLYHQTMTSWVQTGQHLIPLCMFVNLSKCRYWDGRCAFVDKHFLTLSEFA